eukprot:Pgem_evm1s10173
MVVVCVGVGADNCEKKYAVVVVVVVVVVYLVFAVVTVVEAVVDECVDYYVAVVVVVVVVVVVTVVVEIYCIVVVYGGPQKMNCYVMDYFDLKIFCFCIDR